jgi:hypothetical protein
MPPRPKCPYCVRSTAILLALTLAGPLAAQTGAPDWVAVEGPHIDQPSYSTAAALLGTGSATHQDRALDSLEAAIRSGQTSPGDTNLVRLLEAACLAPGRIIESPGQDFHPDLPGVRARGIRLLALLGGDGARAVLSDTLSYESDPAVLSEAYTGLRRLRMDLSPELAPTVIRHLRDPFANGPNDGMVQSILLFLKENQVIGLGQAGKDLFDAILGVYQDHRYLQQTTDLALKTLKTLMGLN